MFHAITSVTIDPDFQLLLSFDDGVTTLADFKPTIRQGGVFTPLADPFFFSQVFLEDGGRVLSWPGELEFDADALRLQANIANDRQTSAVG